MFHVIEFDCPVKDSNKHVELELVVTHFLSVDGDPSCWDSADDYRGYVEIEWDYYTYSIEDQDGGEVACGEGEPPVSLSVSDEAIEEYLIRMMEDDKEMI